MFYEFNPDDAERFARQMNLSAVRKGDELHFKICPYCKAEDKTNTYTFAISMITGQFKCLRASCGVSGNMVKLSQDFDFSLGTDIDEYYRPKKKYRQFKTPTKPIEPKEPAIKYLESRGISESIAKKYEITVQKDRDNVLVFPFFDENKRLTFIKYRKTDFNKETDSNKEWCEKNGKPILFGMKQCNLDNKTLIMAEGQLDSLSISEAGFDNAVSVPNGAKGFTWIPYCWNWVNRFETIIVFGDHEKGHITLLDEIKSRFKKAIKHVREEDYKDCKDANEILQKYGKDQIKVCIDNAEAVQNEKIIRLADVKPVDVFKIQKLQTGIGVLDKLLYGGIPFGGITLITGKPGEGKSTLASQIIVNAIDQNFKVLAYSGELDKSVFRAWMDFQVAGNKVFEYQNKWGDSNFNVKDSDRQLISEWYGDRIYLYDSSGIDNENESLIKLCEEAILQYGIQIILIDNLMTAIDLEAIQGSDKYEKQSLFLKKLARLSLQYNILILLVAHKRKNNFSKNESDEISGSGDIANLGLLIIGYGKSSDIPEENRMLTVAKNRLFGKTNTKGWEVEFDERSKRVYETESELKKKYGWDKESKEDDGFYEDEDNPFDSS